MSRTPERSPEEQARFKARLARVKLLSFWECFEQVALPDLGDLPRKGKLVRCLLPTHDDKSPSSIFHDTHWKCFGCQAGGDALDFLMAWHGVGLRTALTMAEERLGYTATDVSQLATLAAVARRQESEPPATREAWERSVLEIGDAFLQQMRPLLRCPDPTVSGMAESRADFVFESLAYAAASPLPRTRRRTLEQLRDLRRWVTEWARGIESDVERATGRDLLDCAIAAPEPPSPPPPFFVKLLGALIRRQEAKARARARRAGSAG